MTSLVSSVALAGQAPFTGLKTHGMLLAPNGEKMSKSDPSTLLDARDFIDGTEKLDSQRKFGFGVDVLRAWAISKDSDRNSFV